MTCGSGENKNARCGRVSENWTKPSPAGKTRPPVKRRTTVTSGASRKPFGAW